MAWVACAWLMVTAVPARGQVTPEEHAQHHPEGAGPPEGARGGPPGTRGVGPMAGERGGMGGMMERMGAPAPKDLYPSLMNLPSLSPEQQDEFRNQARERIRAGVAIWSAGLDRLAQATQAQDRAAMHEALGQMREGIDQFESGLAAEQAMAEGTAPREVALEWFKQDMNLLPPAAPETGFRLWGMGVFHTFIMAALVLFAAVVIWMYFVKMRRAANLLVALTGGAAGEAEVPSARTAPAVPAAAVPVEPSPHEFTPSQPWSGKLRLCQVFQETHDVKTFRLMNPLGGSIPFIHLPGQFCTLTVAPGGKPVKRNYTLACSPTQHDCVEITVKCDGLVSDYLHNVAKPADLLEIAAPYGSFIFTGREAPSVVLISGGVGITPLMSVTRYLTDRSWPGDIFFLYACRNPKDFIYREELEYLQRRHTNLHLAVTVSNAEGMDWQGPVGRITKEFVTQYVPEVATRRVHICGPPPMMEAIKQILAELGVPKEQVKTEAFGLAQGRPVREAAPAATAVQTEAGGKRAALPTVTFTRSGKSAPLPPDKTVLEVAEEAGVEIDYSCRTGVCGTCKVKLLSGQVTMEVEDGLEPEEKAQGIILACQAKATGDVEVEA